MKIDSRNCRERSPRALLAPQYNKCGPTHLETLNGRVEVVKIPANWRGGKEIDLIHQVFALSIAGEDVAAMLLRATDDCTTAAVGL